MEPQTWSLKEVFRKETYLTLFSWQWSRPLTELTRPNTTPTNNGHAPIKKELSICPSLLCLDLVSFSRVVSNHATGATPGGALPSIPLSFILVTIVSAVVRLQTHPRISPPCQRFGYFPFQRSLCAPLPHGEAPRILPPHARATGGRTPTVLSPTRVFPTAFQFFAAPPVENCCRKLHRVLLGDPLLTERLDHRSCRVCEPLHHRCFLDQNSARDRDWDRDRDLMQNVLRVRQIN